jgi:hypothetical protein
MTAILKMAGNSIFEHNSVSFELFCVLFLVEGLYLDLFLKQPIKILCPRNDLNLVFRYELEVWKVFSHLEVCQPHIWTSQQPLLTFSRFLVRVEEDF